MDDEVIAERVYRRLQEERAGSVLALWADGTITVEPFSFRGRRIEGGQLAEPLLTLPAKSPIRFRDLVERIEKARERRNGW